MLSKLDQLLAKEIISLTLIVTTAVTSIMMMSQLPRYMDFIFQSPDVLTTFIMLLLFIFPAILKFAVPVSLLIACAVVILRMCHDREFEVWLASGTSPWRIMAAPMGLGGLISLISLASALFFEPYSVQQFNQFKWLQTQSLLEVAIKSTLKEKTFVYDFPIGDKTRFAIYSDEIRSSDSHLSHIFMSAGDAENTSSVLTANSGFLKKVVTNGYPDYVFSLEQGQSYFMSNDWSVTRFETMTFSLVNAFKDRFKLQLENDDTTEGLYPVEYFQMLDKKKQHSANWRKDEDIIARYLFIFRQFTIPIATFFLPMIGVCLGISDPRKKPASVYAGLALSIFLLYASISLAQQLALHMILSPVWMLILTPGLMCLLAAFLVYWRLRCPPSVGFFEFLQLTFSKKV